jgi:uncharacterized damage-inducible protein DinB
VTEQPCSLFTLFAGWESSQRRLVTALAPLTLEQLALRGSPHHWSVGRITAHIITARVWWFFSRMGEGSTDLAPLECWDGARQPVRPASELVTGLESTWQMMARALSGWTPADLPHIFPARPDDPFERTRQWIIWHTAEHDIHHGGELCYALGVLSLPRKHIEHIGKETYKTGR